MDKELDRRELTALLSAVGDHLSAEGRSAAILVVGGACMALRRWLSRTTRVVDVIAEADEGGWRAPALDPDLQRIARLVARDFGVEADWLNATVGAFWKTGLPPGFERELSWLTFGGLRVGLAGRTTLIALKLFAAVDQGPSSVHMQDLAALEPGDDELAVAESWVAGQDLNENFPRLVSEAIEHVRRHR